MHRTFLTILSVMLALPATAQDIEGSADHPLVGRYQGSVIYSYDTQEFDEVSLAASAGQVEKAEGAVTRIGYVYPEGASNLQIARNFEQALTEKGFEVMLSCDQDDCGGINYDVEQFGGAGSWNSRFDYRYVLAKREGAEGTVQASLFLSEGNKGLVAVVEAQPMAFRMIDASEMQSAISDTGRVALYGIHFDTDEATIKPDSQPTLDQIAELLTANPGLQVVIVGHTDNQGSMEYNLGLSARRAEAVRSALISQHGIAADRMAHAGAGFLAPVAANTTEAGRALNRRVEIIAR